MKRPVWSWFPPGCLPVWSRGFWVVRGCALVFSLCSSALRATCQEPISCSSSRLGGTSSQAQGHRPKRWHFQGFSLRVLTLLSSSSSFELEDDDIAKARLRADDVVFTLQSKSTFFRCRSCCVCNRRPRGVLSLLCSAVHTVLCDSKLTVIAALRASTRAEPACVHSSPV